MDFMLINLQLVCIVLKLHHKEEKYLKFLKYNKSGILKTLLIEQENLKNYI